MGHLSPPPATRIILLIVTGLLGPVVGSTSQAQTNAQRIGSTHVAGRYYFTGEDFLNEGAAQLLRSGVRVIKVYLSPGGYPYNSTWPANFANPTEMAQHPYYQELFSKSFDTFVMTVYSTTQSDGHYWRGGVTPIDYDTERQQFFALAYHFLTTYRGTGKTFILQHWEGDWALRDSTDLDPAYDPKPIAIAGMIDWLNARQEGVDLARALLPDSDVKVYHACEVNLVQLALQGRPTVTNSVVPSTHCDLYSYSAWDSISGANAQTLRNALDYLAGKAPDSAAFGGKNVYLGEYGWPEQEAGTSWSLSVVRTATQTALNWGCPYLLYWQIYDNECSQSLPTVEQCRGFWLYRADGTVAPVHDYLLSQINPSSLGFNLAGEAVQAVADSTHSSAEVASKAIDGVVAANSKWTSAGTNPPHWLALDLGRDRRVQSFVVRHAGAGQETTGYNTQQFRIQSASSLSGPWTDDFVVDNASQYNLTVRSYFTPRLLRYVRLYISDPGSDNYARIPEFQVWGDPGVADFGIDSPTIGHAPLAVAFTDQSTGEIDTWSWDLGDGSTSNERNPTHAYTRPGVFSVRLTITGPGGTTSRTLADTVVVRGADLDHDGDVDQEDFASFQTCLSGTLTSLSTGCDHADFDANGWVDELDTARFLTCFSGPDVTPATPNCP